MPLYLREAKLYQIKEEHLPFEVLGIRDAFRNLTNEQLSSDKCLLNGNILIVIKMAVSLHYIAMCRGKNEKTELPS